MTRTPLARRLPLVMAGVATIAVLIGALVSWPLLMRAADASARKALSRTADLTAEALQRSYEGGEPLGGRGINRIESLLAPQQVTAYLVIQGSQVPSPLSAADVTTVTGGGDVSAKRLALSGASFVEGRAVVDGLGILLVQPTAVSRDLSSPALARLAVALALGLTVAVVVGYVVARRLTRPLGEVAAAAHARTSGQRDVRIAPHV